MPVQIDPATDGELHDRQAARHAPSLRLDPDRIAWALGAVVILLLLLNLVAPFLALGLGRPRLLGFVPEARRLFTLDQEANLPTWFSSMLLLAGALAAGALALEDSPGGLRPWRSWRGLALLLLILSADETAQLHESVSRVLQGMLTGLAIAPPDLSIATVEHVQGAILAVAAIIWFLPWGLGLAPRTRRRLCRALLVYLAGALGADTLPQIVGKSAPGTIGYLAWTSTEEVLEMLGLILLLHALLDEARRRSIRPRITFGQGMRRDEEGLATPEATPNPTARAGQA